MKYYCSIALLLIVISAYSHQTEDPGKKAVTETVNKFFEALAKKDTVLYKSIAFSNGQIWVTRNQQDSVKTQMRYIRDDFSYLPQMKESIEEKPLKMDIRLHGNIAIAWVPYTFSLGGKFSHCGIDVFTLLNTRDGWKIVSCVYSVEPEGCAAIKKENGID